MEHIFAVCGLGNQFVIPTFPKDLQLPLGECDCIVHTDTHTHTHIMHVFTNVPTNDVKAPLCAAPIVFCQLVARQHNL